MNARWTCWVLVYAVDQQCWCMHPKSIMEFVDTPILLQKNRLAIMAKRTFRTYLHTHVKKNAASIQVGVVVYDAMKQTARVYKIIYFCARSHAKKTLASPTTNHFSWPKIWTPPLNHVSVKDAQSQQWSLEI